MDAQTIQADNGGRPLANDDLLVLQNQALGLGLPALLAGLSPCLVSGCQVFQTGTTVWNVAAGMVWTGAQLLPFPGQSNVSLPAMFQAGPVQVVDARAYQDGTTKTAIKSQHMELVAVVANAPNLVVDTYGALTFWHRVQEKTRSTKLVEWVATLDTTHYDAAGLGKPGTSGWGWGLCDGQGGRVDLQGRFVAGLDLSRADYNNIGNTGGAEKVALDITQMPAHHHGVDAFNAVNNNTGATLRKGDRDSGGTSFSTGDTGGGLPHENRPPFYVLAARQWVGY